MIDKHTVLFKIVLTNIEIYEVHNELNFNVNWT